ncbi:TPA: hypothetical protein ACH3X1_000809 [Trebouxia sp. C0004]
MSIRRHGPSAFKWTTLRSVSADQGKAAEKAAIAEYNTYEDPQHYNLTPGGDMAEYMLAMRDKQALTVRTHQQERSVVSASRTMNTGKEVGLAEECLKQCQQAIANGTAPPAAKPKGYQKADPSLPNGVVQTKKNGKTLLVFRGSSGKQHIYKDFRHESHSERLAAAKAYIDTLDQPLIQGSKQAILVPVGQPTNDRQPCGFWKACKPCLAADIKRQNSKRPLPCQRPTAIELASKSIKDSHKYPMHNYG